MVKIAGFQLVGSEDGSEKYFQEPSFYIIQDKSQQRALDNAVRAFISSHNPLEEQMRILSIADIPNMPQSYLTREQ